jgi:hypothetical protein
VVSVVLYFLEKLYEFRNPSFNSRVNNSGRKTNGYYFNKGKFGNGRAITQEVSHVTHLPPRRAGFEPKVRSCGICGEQTGIGAGLFGVLRFLIPLTAAHSSSYIIRAAILSQIVAHVPSGLSLTPL